MSEDRTDYASMFTPAEVEQLQKEPETIEDLEALETSVESVDVDAIVDEANAINEEEPEDEGEVSTTTSPTLYYPNLDEGINLRVRSAPNGDVLMQINNKTLLTVLDSSNNEWAFVEFDNDGEKVQGYVKKSFIIEA